MTEFDKAMERFKDMDRQIGEFIAAQQGMPVGIQFEDEHEKGLEAERGRLTLRWGRSSLLDNIVPHCAICIMADDFPIGQINYNADDREWDLEKPMAHECENENLLPVLAAVPLPDNMIVFRDDKKGFEWIEKLINFFLTYEPAEQ